MNDAIKLVAITAQDMNVVRVVAQLEHPDGEYLGSWIMRWTAHDQQWVQFQVRWIATSIAVISEPALEVAAIGPEGQALLLDRQGSRVDFPGGTSDAMLANGFMREVRCVGDSFVACGMGRQVYRRDSRGTWQAIHQGVLAPQDQIAPVGLNSIHGTTPDALVAVGFLGEIWRLSAGQWVRDVSPTNVTLHKVVCALGMPDFAGGKLGTLLNCVGGQWSQLPQPGLTDDIRDLVWHGGRLYAATGTHLLALSDDGLLEAVKCQPPDGCTQLASSGDRLWVVNPKRVLWSTDLHSWNDITP